MSKILSALELSPYHANNFPGVRHPILLRVSFPENNVVVRCVANTYNLEKISKIIEKINKNENVDEKLEYDIFSHVEYKPKDVFNAGHIRFTIEPSNGSLLQTEIKIFNYPNLVQDLTNMYNLLNEYDKKS